MRQFLSSGDAHQTVAFFVEGKFLLDFRPQGDADGRFQNLFTVRFAFQPGQSPGVNIAAEDHDGIVRQQFQVDDTIPAIACICLILHGVVEDVVTTRESRQLHIGPDSIVHVLGSEEVGVDTAPDIVVMAQEDAIIIGHHIGADVGPDKGCQIFQGNHIAGVFQHLFLHRHAGLHHQDFPQGAIHHGINHSFRHALIVRYHQAGIVLPIQIALVIDLRQNIRRKDVIVQKIVVQFLCALFQRQPVPVHPMSFRIIEDRRHRHMDAPGMQMADALHIIHDVAEILEQGILAGLVEVGRAVQVIGLGRKGMGHIVIDAPDQHMVRQILHVFRSLGPAEGTENLAHGPALFLRVHMGQGGAKLSQIIMEKVIFHMFIADTAGAGAFRQTRDQLVQHNVDTGHILVCQGPEIMGCTVGGLGMGIVVLDDMANVLNSMFPAPGAQLGAEIAAVLPGNDVHVGIADPV